MSLFEKALPKSGLNFDQITQLVEERRKEDHQWREGKLWSLIYQVSPEHEKIIKHAHNTMFFESTLNPMIFKSIKQMESETVQMIANYFKGSVESVTGLLTTGGTESIVMAVLTYRELFKERFPKKIPNIVVSQTVHPAFDKACHLLGLEIRKAKLKSNLELDLNHFEKLINSHTCLIVGSAPNYPFGMIDPLDEMNQIAKKYNLPMHIDACLGGFMLPWLKKLGHALPTVSFDLESVGSISLDNHKFGFSSKGVSTLLYRNVELLAKQFFISTDWCGGVYFSASFTGTKGGGPIASAWASLLALGEDGFLNLAKQAMESTVKIKEAIMKSGFLEVLGNPSMNVIAFKSSKKAQFSIFALADQLVAKGWHIDRQHRPEAIHMIVTPLQQSQINQFCHDLEKAIDDIHNRPLKENDSTVAMYGMIAKFPIRSVVKDQVMQMVKKMYAAEVKGDFNPSFKGKLNFKDELKRTVGRWFSRG